MFRFLYLNLYAFVLVGAGILTLTAPFYWISRWALVLQVIAAINLFVLAGKLFATWGEKKRAVRMLVRKNRFKFRPESFEAFLQAPCGKLVVRLALKDLDRQGDYTALLKLQKPLLERWRHNCTPVKTTVYINREGI